MKNFIDTNIALGYSLNCDKMHETCLEFISNNEDIFWSNNVKQEFQKKYEQIFQLIHNFMLMTSSIVNTIQKSFINYYSFEKFILDNTKDSALDIYKKTKIIEFFWENNNINYNISPLETLIRFNQFLANYDYSHDSRKKELENLIELYDCGLNNYLKYPKLLKKLIKSGVHNPDYKIVLDAHDFGFTSDVCFITTDLNLIQLIKDCKLLNIMEFKTCT
ncbi:MAG: hypothetical protein IKH29_02300 [Methanobrevibacter sp.]|uniref:hypothetical protein n=1 Tax=Methanobrevibacter sp. TaxID=66852 RepID=UPI0025F430C4|nr:hypothetical protein [Methanobrevibacter sp.]MBR3112528.1 hypothetical protein [Methanobrevibacter sp.]